MSEEVPRRMIDKLKAPLFFYPILGILAAMAAMATNSLILLAIIFVAYVIGLIAVDMWMEQRMRKHFTYIIRSDS